MNKENIDEKHDPLKSIAIVILIYIVAQFIASIIMMSKLFSPFVANPDMISVIESPVASCLITLFLTIFISFRVFKFKANEIGFSKYRIGSRLLIGFVLAFICQLSVFIISLALGVTQIQGVRLNIFALLFTLFISFSAGISEETLCRGFLVVRLKPTKNLLLIVLAPTLIFTLIHIVNMLSIGLNLTLSILALSTTFLAGIFLVLIVIRTGSLAMAIAWHVGWDFLTPIFGGNLSGINTGFPLINVTHNGPNILTGGAYGLEASIFSLITLLVLVILFYKFYPKSTPDLENKLMSLEFK
jgi:membrane protease YdiL (CAAX protease family)